MSSQQVQQITLAGACIVLKMHEVMPHGDQAHMGNPAGTQHELMHGTAVAFKHGSIWQCHTRITLTTFTVTRWQQTCKEGRSALKECEPVRKADASKCPLIVVCIVGKQPAGADQVDRAT